MAALLLTVPDLVCLDDLDAFGRETTSDLESLWQDIYHMLVEELGSNIDDTSRGIGVRQLLSGSTDALDKLSTRIDQGLQNDPRIDASTTTIEEKPDGGFRIAIQIQVGATVTGLEYSWSSAGGLVFEGSQ